jgi:hypothetical protein
MTAKRYHSLLERQANGRWAIAFGDYDRECVVQEREDMIDSAMDDDATEYKIITTADDQASIDAKVATLNATL